METLFTRAVGTNLSKEGEGAVEVGIPGDGAQRK